MQNQDTFLAACGAQGPLSVTAVGPADGERREHTIEAPCVVAGREARCDVALDDERVSSTHLYLQVLAGRVYAVDLGSRTGCFRGMSPCAAAWLRPREFVRVGPFHVRCELTPAEDPEWEWGPPAEPLSERTPDSSMLPQLSADIMLDGRIVSQWRINRCLALIGRAPDARVKLVGPGVSKYHCCLVVTPAGFWVADLCSAGGITLNGARAKSGAVREGDCLGVGPYNVVFRPRSPVQTVTLLEKPAPGRVARPLGLPGADGPQTLVPAPQPTFLPAALPDPSPPGPPAALEVGNAALLPILQQFGQMQQHMMDQFQQTLLMMMQMIHRMHTDQMDLVRTELQRLRELSLEIQEARLNQQALARAAEEARREKPPGRARQPAPINGAAASHAPAPRPTPQPPAEAPEAPPPGPTPPPPANAEADADVHGALAAKIAALEAQRQTIWQRILGALPGFGG